MQLRPNQKTIEEQVEDILKEFFPQYKNPTNDAKKEFDEIKQLVLKDIVTTQQDFKSSHPINPDRPFIEQSIAKHTREKEEKEIENVIKQYTQLKLEEEERLKKQVKKEMDDIEKSGVKLNKNPTAQKTMIKLLVLKNCPKPKLKPGIDPTAEAKKNLTKLKKEYQDLIDELKKTDSTLADKLTIEMKRLFLEMENKIKLFEKENKLDEKQNIDKEVSELFKTVITLSDPPQGKEFKDLKDEEKVKIVTQGSNEGKYRTTPKNDIDMPPSIIVFPGTPAANEIKDPEAKSTSILGKTPTPSPFADKSKGGV